MPLFEPLLDALNRAAVRYVVVGWFATVLHGYARLTADIDLVVDLAPDEARKAVDLFAEHPFDFEELWTRAEIITLARAVARIASIPDLIRLKRIAGWEAHRFHQLTLALSATPAQQLARLEEVIILAHRVGALPRPRD
ncbi:MAG: hypothetical protein HY727_12940 [Candidatus Rokubacteria bacterium]|nr:hypothetical protein [Candidatus Rokubacteria bacterium]